MEDLALNFQLQPSALSHLTSAVQFGFIVGTLLFAILTISDRFSPSMVFFVSAVFGALFNLAIVLEINQFASLLVLRFLTGFCLAGIYPIGMKIASDYYDKGLGKSLGFLVGALVLGTAFPHLPKGLSESLPWKQVLIITSTLAAIGGTLMLLLVPNGPNRKSSQGLDIGAFFGVFKSKPFRSAAFGYFGHMWELYAFWAFVPVILMTYNALHEQTDLNVSLLSFFIIGIGGLACVAAGYISERYGTKKTAGWALLLSGACCLLLPIVFAVGSQVLFLGFLFFWGMVVIADSPLFSTLVAQNASSSNKGTALTIVNCIGFSITIASIQLLKVLLETTEINAGYMVLALGPAIGLIALFRKGSQDE